MNTTTPHLECTQRVDSLLHPRALEVRAVLNRAQRRLGSHMLIDDDENILQALHSGVRLESVFVTEDERLSLELARRLPVGVPVHEVARRTSKKLFENEKVSRVFAIAFTPHQPQLGELGHLKGDLVALEDLGIAGNIGAIIRSAAALGAGGVVLLNTDAVDVYDRRLIRASRGLVFALPVVTASAAELLEFCDRFARPLTVTAPRATMDVSELREVTQRLVIAFGNEKTGCSSTLMNAAKLRVRIELNPMVESLNVSAAAGIVLHQRQHGRHPARA